MGDTDTESKPQVHHPACGVRRARHARFFIIDVSTHGSGVVEDCGPERRSNENMEKRKNETKGEEAEERADVRGATKHVMRRDENGRGWPGPAVARVAPRCGIGASTMVEAGITSESKKFVFLCVCVSVFPCLCLWQMVKHA